MKIKPFAFSFLVAFIIALFFLFTIFCIFFKYAGDIVVAKDALGATASFFGGMATLGAAVIAGYLFNDWREQEKYKITSNLAMECLQDYLDAKDLLLFYLFQHIYKTPTITFKELDDFFFKTNHKITTLNEVLIRLNKPTIDEEVVEAFYKNNYLEVIKTLRSNEILKQYNAAELKEYHERFIGNKKMNLLPHMLLDVLKLS